MPHGISGYLSIYNDWDILPPALASVAPYLDELVVVDGGYEWMAEFLQRTGRTPGKSAQPVYDALEASGIPYRVVSGLWPNEFEKRKAGYLACRNRYVFRVDADEIFFVDEAHLEAFLSAGAAVGEGEFPLFLTPRWLLADRSDAPDRTSFFFDARQIGAEDHLRYLWLIDELPRRANEGPPVFGPALSTTAHLTSWRTPRTAVNRAAFYVLNHFRRHGVPFYPDLASRPLHDLGSLFARIPPAAFLDALKGHRIVAGDEQLNNRILRPSPLSAMQESRVAPVFEKFLKSQRNSLVHVAANGRWALGQVHFDITSPQAAAVLAKGGECTFDCRPEPTRVEACVRYLIPEEPWEVVRPAAVRIERSRVAIELPFGQGEPDFVRRFLVFEGWPRQGGPLLKFRPIKSGQPPATPAPRTAEVPEKRGAAMADAAGPDRRAAAGGAIDPPAPDRAHAAPAPAAAIRDEAKIEYLRQVRRQYIDPSTKHPLYDRFVDFLERHEDDPHYPRFAMTMAELANCLGDVFAPAARPSICETGSLSLISLFFQEQGYAVRGTTSDLRYSIDADAASADIVLSLEVIEHLKDQKEKHFAEVVSFHGTGVRQYVREIRRVLRPGGFAVLTTPNPASLSSLISLINYDAPMIYRPHVREYTKAELLKFFEDFKPIGYRTFYAYAYLGHGPEVAKEYAAKLGWNPEDRGDCHFFVFQKP